MMATDLPWIVGRRAAPAGRAAGAGRDQVHPTTSKGIEMKWKDTLPEPLGHDAEEHFNRALTSLLYALAILATDPDWALVRAAKAASEIRAWRTSLPDQRERVELDPHAWDDRGLLRHAAHSVLFADKYCANPSRGSIHLRHAEAALRELWRRHQEER